MAEFYAEGGVPGDLAVGTADAVPTQTERILAAVVQGAYFVGGIGFLVLRNRSVFVAHHAKQAFLSQCVVFVLFTLACVLGVVLDDSNIAVGLCFVVGIPWCLGAVYAVVKALSGERWSFPGLGWAG